MQKCLFLYTSGVIYYSLFMQATSQKINAYTYEVTIKESAADMEKHRKVAAKKIAQVRQFPGFKKGSDVPVEVVAREIGEDRLMSEALDEALQVLYPKALKKLEIVPVDSGEITKITSLKPLEVTLAVEIYPEVKLDIKKLEKIKVDVAETSVSDEELEKEMQGIIERYTHYHARGDHHGHAHDENGDVSETTDPGIQSGDKVRVNALGYDKK